jgi:tetratricopeptide (TPR) repeat protein
MRRALIPVVLIFLLAVAGGCTAWHEHREPFLIKFRLRRRLSEEHYRLGETHLERKEFYSAAKDFLLAGKLDETFSKAWDRYHALQPVLSDDSREWGEQVEFPPRVPRDAWSLVKYEVGRELMELGEYEIARTTFSDLLELCDCLPPPFQEWKPYLEIAIWECDRCLGPPDKAE